MVRLIETVLKSFSALPSLFSGVWLVEQQQSGSDVVRFV